MLFCVSGRIVMFDCVCLRFFLLGVVRVRIGVGSWGFR